MSGKVKRLPVRYRGDKERTAIKLRGVVADCFSSGLTMHEVIAIVWSTMIKRALVRCFGNQTQAAKELGISRTTLQWYLRKEKADAETQKRLP